MHACQKLIEFYEDELSRLCGVAHSGMVQDAAAARLWLSSCSVDSLPRELADLLAIVTRSVDQSVHKGRRLMSDLRPLSFADAELVELVEDLMSTLQQAQRGSVTWSWEGSDPPWCAWQKRALARILSHVVRIAEEFGFEDFELRGRGTETGASTEIEVDSQIDLTPVYLAHLAGPLSTLFEVLQAHYSVDQLAAVSAAHRSRICLTFPWAEAAAQA